MKVSFELLSFFQYYIHEFQLKLFLNMRSPPFHLNTHSYICTNQCIRLDNFPNIDQKLYIFR